MSSVRVNPNQLPDLLSALQQARQEQATATLQLATGSRINRPSDDPAGAAQLISNRDQSSQADSFLRSIGSVSGLLQTADSTLGSVVNALQRAISLGVQGANGTLSSADRADVAAELTGIQAQLVSLGNTSYQGEFIFAGTATVQPFAVSASSSSGISYLGNNGTNTVQVGTSYSLQVNQPGSQIFTTAGSDVFQAMSDLISALQSNTGISGAVSALRAAFDYVTSQRVFYGNAINQLNGQQDFLNSEKADFANTADSIGGADLAATATAVNQTGLAINAELSAMSHISQVSLFNYLA